MKKVLFLSSTHYSKDDRTFYHHAMCLAKNKYNSTIISLIEDKNNVEGKITIDSHNISELSYLKKIIFGKDILTDKKPDIIICDSPQSVFSSALYRLNNSCKIIYDITEWYPSKKNFTYKKRNNWLIKPIIILSLTILNIFAACLSNILMFGEYYKSLPFNFLFWKKKIQIQYYPDLSYINYTKPKTISDEINIFYSGKINIEKGIDKVIEVVSKVGYKCPETQIKLNIVGFFENDSDKSFVDKLCSELPENISVNIASIMEFEMFCATITQNDIFLDLRIKDIENNHCLPIKIFYYMACGRPIIYSDLKAITKEVKTDNIGLLCNPNNTELISDHICNYIQHQSLYETHCNNSLHNAERYYNWASINKNFIQLIDNC